MRQTRTTLSSEPCPDAVLASAGTARGERGASLIAVMAVMTAVLLVGTALFVFGVAEHDLATFQSEDVSAFYIAEAGVARAKAFLDGKYENGEYIAAQTFTDQALANGTYTVSIQNVGGASQWYTEYDVVSTGTVNGVSRRVHVTVGMATYAQYIWFIEHNGSIETLTTGDVLDGSCYGDAYIQIDGDPWFGGVVTTTMPYLAIQAGSNPTFMQGYEVDVDPIDLPNRNQIRNFIRTTAQDGGIYLGNVNGSDAHWEVVFGRNGVTGTLSYRSYRKQGQSYEYSDWVDEDISNINGAIYAQRSVWIEGVVDGEISIFCQQDITITDDLLYHDSTPGSGPNPGCDDLLGVYSRQDIVIQDNAANQSDCEIHAALIAFRNSLKAENVGSGGLRGDLIVYGSLVQRHMGDLNRFSTPGMLTRGYSRKYYHDSRLLIETPPYYPQMGTFVIKRWEEVPVI